MMKIVSITKGILNNFTMFYSEVEFYNYGLNEVYETLKEVAEQEMIKSPELWVAMFDSKDKTYAIMGNGALTSSGEYLIAEIEK